MRFRNPNLLVLVLVLLSLIAYSITVLNVTETELGKVEFVPIENFTVDAYNHSSYNFTINMSTEKWAGIFGTLDAQGSFLILSNDTSSYVYKWQWSASNEGICASTNGSILSLTYLSNVSTSYLDTTWGFNSSHSDSAEKTFNEPPAAFSSGGLSATGVNRSKTGPDNPLDPFYTHIMKTTSGNPTAKSDFIFCTTLNSSGKNYLNQTVDYELILPTNETAGANEPYYLYLLI